MKTGTGTIRRFQGSPDGVTISLERFGGEVDLPVTQEVVDRLLNTYGLRTSDSNMTSMVPIIGLHCRWTEASGVLVEVTPLAN